MISLEEFTAPLLGELPVEEQTHIILNPANCKQAPEELESERLKIIAWPLGHSYGDSARFDVIHFFADKETYRALGLLIFSAVFHPNTIVTLHLRHPETKVERLVVVYECSTPEKPLPNELVKTPAAFSYWPKPPESRHPLYWGKRWERDSIDRLPMLDFTNQHGQCVNAQDFAARNVVCGFGGALGSATVAALLLDIGLPANADAEFSLEAAPGYQSVRPGSAEARFWVGYDYVL